MRKVESVFPLLNDRFKRDTYNGNRVIIGSSDSLTRIRPVPLIHGFLLSQSKMRSQIRRNIHCCMELARLNLYAFVFSLKKDQHKAEFVDLSYICM